MSTFTDYFAQRVRASNAFVDGDVAPLFDVSTAEAPASIFGPSGTVVVGPVEVNASNAAGSAHFAGADRNDLQELHSGVDGALAYWVGVQRSVVHLRGKDEPVTFDLRITELYRRESSGWKLFHRYADPVGG